MKDELTISSFGTRKKFATALQSLRAEKIKTSNAKAESLSETMKMIITMRLLIVIVILFLIILSQQLQVPLIHKLLLLRK